MNQRQAAQVSPAREAYRGEDQQQGENDAQSHLGGTGRALADHRVRSQGRRKQRGRQWLRFTALDHHEDDRCNDSDDQDAYTASESHPNSGTDPIRQ